MDFENIWDTYESRRVIKMKRKKTSKTLILTIMAFMMLSVAGFAINETFNRDNIDYEFILDEELVGGWDAIDFVKEKEDFDPNEKNVKEELFLNELYFDSNGRVIRGDDNGNKSSTSFTYTKGHILDTVDSTDSEYEIKLIDGTTYLFMQWKSGDYVFNFKKPSYYVFKRINDVDMSMFEEKSVRNDDMDYEFTSDSSLIGDWNAVDFVDNVDDFISDKRYWQGELHLLEVTVEDGGTSLFKFVSSDEIFEGFQWTKGKFVDKENKCVEDYYIVEINGKDYLFLPWLSGDVILRGMKPCYYVFERAIN